MAIFKDYNGNPIEIPIHTHAVSDTKNSSGTTALASTTTDGFMTKEYKTKLDTLKTKSSTLHEKLKSGMFIELDRSTLITGNTFSSTVSNLGGTSMVFTDTPIPSDKIASAKVVSTTDSPVKTYAYLDGTTVYISPEQADTVIFANADCANMFSGKTYVSIDFTNFDTSNTTSMRNMFYNCTRLTSIIFTYRFNTENVTDMSYMFYACSSLTALNFNSRFNTKKVTTMTNMFYNCNKLEYANLDYFDFTAATNISRMFYMCTVIESSIIINSSISTYSEAFINCASTSGSLLVNYKSGFATFATTLVNSKSAASNVKLGIQV